MIYQFLKSLLPCLLICFINTTCFGQMGYYNNLKSWHIKGKVDSIIKNEYKVKNGDSSQTIVDTKYVSFYDQKGNLLKYTTYPYATIREYHMVNAKPMRDTIKYDEKGDLLEKISHDSSGTPIWKYTFNSFASLIEVKTYYVPYSSLPNTNYLPTTTKLSLDKNGNVVDVSSYDHPSAKLTYHHKYKYDANNNCIEDVEISQETLYEYKTVKTYISDELVKEVNYDEHGGLMATYNYAYIRYDGNHNWILRKMYFNGRLSSIEERTIVYRK